MASRVSTARRLRRDQTDAERALWFRLRDRRLNGLKFRRQMLIKSYVVDFCCESARLILELDGGQHAELTAEDARRTADLEAYGYLVLRFWNNDVLRNIDGVLETIVATASHLPPHPDPLPAGEREKTAVSQVSLSVREREHF
ncbi:MAG TPA: endonuclease domain-containing protein [Pseudolabrys sp.]|nr:endonuclease domain-containing protein [Pseudolabrys sp.]